MAQPLMDMPEPDPETQALMRKTGEHDDLPLFAPMEKGNHGLWESLVDKMNKEVIVEDGG